MPKNEQDELIITLLIVVGFLAIFLMTLSVQSRDDIDIDNQLGPYLCEQHNLTFNDYHIERGDTHSSKLISLKITCKNTTKEKQIADSYLVEIT